MWGLILLILVSAGHLVRSALRAAHRSPETLPSTPAAAPDSGVEFRRVASEQAALRRVATLAAREMAPSVLYDAVAAEAGGVVGADATALVRFDEDHSVTVAGTWQKPGISGIALPRGSRWPVEEYRVAARVLQTGESALTTSGDGGIRADPGWAVAHGIRSAIGSPVAVAGQLWGALIAFCGTSAADPDETEEELLAFTELVAMAIACGHSRAQLAASRARVVAAADETRRRIERDLHDATQQRLISLALELRVAQSRLPPEVGGQLEQWSRTAEQLTDAAEELRKISEKLYPTILETAGLAPAVRAVVRRAGVPVKLSTQVCGRLPQRVEIAAYYAVSEALANAVTHARASVIEVNVDTIGDDLRLRVRDDGVGGADTTRGSGLIGLTDRIEAAGGRVEIASPAGGGTTVLVSMPLRAP